MSADHKHGWMIDCNVVRSVHVLLAAILHNQHHQRRLYPLRPVRAQLGVSSGPATLLVLRLARIHQQFPQPAHLHHFQRGIPSRLQQHPATSMRLSAQLHRLLMPAVIDCYS